MSNFIEFAIRLQHKKPLPIDNLAESPCGVAYLDARSIIRGYRPVREDGPFFEQQLSFVSTVDNGQLILRVAPRLNPHSPPSEEASVLLAVRQALGQRETEIFTRMGPAIPVEPGSRYVVFSQTGCRVDLDGRATSENGVLRATWTGAPGQAAVKAEAACEQAGWARTTLPPYMGL